MLGTIESQEVYIKLREMGEYFYGDVGKGFVWGPTADQWDNNKPNSLPGSKEILSKCGLEKSPLGWEVFLGQNWLQAPEGDGELDEAFLGIDYSEFYEETKNDDEDEALEFVERVVGRPIYYMPTWELEIHDSVDKSLSLDKRSIHKQFPTAEKPRTLSLSKIARREFSVKYY